MASNGHPGAVLQAIGTGGSQKSRAFVACRKYPMTLVCCPATWVALNDWHDAPAMGRCIGMGMSVATLFSV
jgi:hypothetical protein